MIDLKKPLPQELIDLPESDFQMIQSEEIHDEKFQTKPIGFFKDAMIRLSKSPVAVTSFTIIVIIILSSLIVPNITGYGYRQQNIAAKDLPPRIPLLEDIAGEGVPQRSAARLTATAREDDRYLTEQAQAAYRSIRLPTGAGLPIAALCALPPAISHRVMRLAYRDAVNAFPDACSDDGINMNTDTDILPSDRTLTAAHLAAIDALCTAAVPHSQAPLPYGWRAVCRPADADRLLCFVPPEKADDRPADTLPPQTLQEGDNPWGNTVIRIEHLPAPASPLDGDGVLASVVLPAETLPLPLTVRPRRAGDRILCHGMHKKLKKLICDKHIPPSEREALPVICHPAQADGDTVLWVPAVAVCDGYPPPQSGGALRITVLRAR